MGNSASHQGVGWESELGGKGLGTKGLDSERHGINQHLYRALILAKIFIIQSLLRLHLFSQSILGLESFT